MSNDINLLYAAKNFVNYLRLDKSPPSEENKVAIETLVSVGNLENLLEQRYEKMLTEFDLNRLEADLENDDDKFMIDLGWALQNYHEFVSDAETLVEESKKSDPSAAPLLRESLSETTLENFLVTFEGYVIPRTKLYQVEESEEQKQTRESLQKFCEEDERKHKAYLASDGLDTKEGYFAWTVANYAGIFLQGFVHTGGVLPNSVSPVAEVVNKGEIKLTEKALHGPLYDAVVDGYCGARDAVVENEDDFLTQSKNWLFSEVQQRLATEQEFNLLETVALRKDKDGLIHVRLDRKADPY